MWGKKRCRFDRQKIPHSLHTSLHNLTSPSPHSQHVKKQHPDMSAPWLAGSAGPVQIGVRSGLPEARRLPKQAPVQHRFDPYQMNGGCVERLEAGSALVAFALCACDRRTFSVCMSSAFTSVDMLFNTCAKSEHRWDVEKLKSNVLLRLIVLAARLWRSLARTLRSLPQTHV